MKLETLRKLDQLSIYLQICKAELEAQFGSIHDGLISPDNWKIPNQKRTRRILRRSLKKYGEEKDSFDYLFPEHELDFYLRQILWYGTEKMQMPRRAFHYHWFSLWQLRDLTKYLKGPAEDYCEILCDMAELALAATDVIDDENN